MSNPTVEVNGHWSDGISSALIPSLLTIKQNGICTVSDQLSAPLHLVKITDRLGNTPRQLRFPGGGLFTTDENDAIDVAVKMHVQTTPSLISQLEQSWRLAATSLVIVALLSLGFIFYGLPHIAKTVAMKIPPELQEEMGQDVITVMDKTWMSPSELTPDQQLRLQQQFQLLMKSANRSEQTQLLFRRLRDNDANAFALPDGTVVLTDGLVQLAQDNDEIIAVLAHELGHLQQRHALRTVLQHAGLSMLLLGVTGDSSNLAPIIASLPTALMSARYSRDFETEADAYAAELMQRHGIPETAFTDMLRRLSENNQTEDVQPPALLLSHPITTERITTFQQSWRATANK